MCTENGWTKGIGQTEIGERYIRINVGGQYPAERQRRTGTGAPGVEEVTGSNREPGFIGSDIDKRSVQTGNVIASTPFLPRQRSCETEKNSERRDCRGKCFGEAHGFRLTVFMAGNRAENQQFFAFLQTHSGKSKASISLNSVSKPRDVVGSNRLCSHLATLSRRIQFLQSSPPMRSGLDHCGGVSFSLAHTSGWSRGNGVKARDRRARFARDRRNSRWGLLPQPAK